MEAGKKSDLEMVLPEARLKSFTNWPFTEDCKCTPKNMSDAGFYCCGGDSEPDLVRCYFCRKELDGWEPSDDPWKEHKSHAKGTCAYVNLGKKPEDMTVQDLYSLEPAKVGMVIRSMMQKKVEAFKKDCETARKGLEKLY